MANDLLSCQHPLDQRIVETMEVDTMRNGEHDTYDTKIYVCGDCGEQLDGIPELDDDWVEDDLDR